MSLQIKGKILQILKSESGVSRAGNEWKKQEFIVETTEQFPKKICFTLFNDKTSLIDGFTPGTEVDVSFNVESREFNGKWFHNINAWKIEKPSAGKQEEHLPEYRIEDIPPEADDDLSGGMPF